MTESRTSRQMRGMEIAMGLLDTLMNMAGSQSAAPADSAIHGPLIEQILGMVTNRQTGGLGGLLEKLKGGGLQSAVTSWVGNGPNQSVSASQIQAALGSDQIKQLAQKLGLPGDQVASHLAQILPEVVNHLTPNGSVPEHGLLEQAAGLLRKRVLGQ